MKILCCYVFDWEKEYIQKQFGSCEFLFVNGTIRNCSSKTDPSIEALCVFIDSPITQAVFAKFPKLKFIVTRSSGFDHIDLAEAKKRNIVVSSVPAYGKCAVAEYTFGLMLNLARNICDGRDLTRQAIFSAPETTGIDLEGKTLGVVGTGAIGSHVVRLAKAFGMNVLACDVRPNQKLATELGFTYVSFEELLAKSDMVTLHVCYTKNTHHLINHETIKKMRQGSYLINTSRGAVIETAALVYGLQEGILAGVAMDVFEDEAALADEAFVLLDKQASASQLQILLATHYLARHPRVLMGPHNAYNSRQALERIWEVAGDNIKAFMAGKPINIVPCE